MAQNRSDSIKANAPKPLDEKYGVFRNGKWGPFEDIDDFNEEYPPVVQFENMMFWMRSTTDVNKADLYSLREDKTPYKILEDIEVSEVARTGSYNDLIDKPNITDPPVLSVNERIGAVTGLAEDSDLQDFKNIAGSDINGATPKITTVLTPTSGSFTATFDELKGQYPFVFFKGITAYPISQLTFDPVTGIVTFPNEFYPGESVFAIYVSSQAYPSLGDSYARLSSFNSLLNDFNKIVLRSKNLLNKDDVDKYSTIDKYTSFSSGAFVSNTSYLSVIVRLEPLTTYTYFGFNSSFAANEYKNTVNPLDLTTFNSVSRVVAIGTNTGQKTQIQFTTSAETYWGVFHVTNGGNDALLNTAMLYKGTLAELPPYEPYFMYPDIKEAIGFVPKTVTVTERISDNIIDESLIRIGFFSVNGSINSENVQYRRTELTPVSGNSQYTFSAEAKYVINTQKNLNFYKEDGTFIQNVKITSNPFTFNTPIGTSYLGTTVIFTADATIADWFMLNEGATALPHDVYETETTDVEVQVIDSIYGYKLNSSEVITPTEDISDYYYSLQKEMVVVNPLTDPVDRFMSYMRYGNTKFFAGYKVDHFVNAPKYTNLWRIAGANIYELIDGVMETTGVEILFTSESEYVFRVTGDPDSTGGFHGYEELINVNFFIDNMPISIDADIPLTACKSISYAQKSTMYAYSTNTPRVTHSKISEFILTGYECTNKVTWLQTVASVNSVYAGLCCMGKSQGKYFYSDNLIVTPRLGDDGFKLNEKGGSGFINYFDDVSGLSAKVWAGFIKVITSDVNTVDDFNRRLTTTVFDRDTDPKFYNRFNNIAVTSGDIWVSKMIVNHYKKV